MSTQLDEIIVFETEAEMEAFKQGFLRGAGETPYDLLSKKPNEKYTVELLRIHEEDYQIGGRYYVEGESAQIAAVIPCDVAVGA